MRTTATLGEVIGSPELPFLVRELNEVLAAEQKERARFYDEFSESKKAEFINGRVFVHSPVRKKHSEVVKRVLSLLDAVVERSSLGFVSAEKTLICLSRNDYEPDVVFFSKEKADLFTPDTMKFPAPDFVVEVLSGSKEHHDRGIKFKDYALHGVREYWIIDPEKETVEQYTLSGREYLLKVKLDNGSIRSTVVERFEIPVRAIFESGEHQRVLRELLG